MPMAPRRAKRPRPPCINLEELVCQLRDWLETGKRVETLRSSRDAAAVVSSALKFVSYEKSLNEWWRWYARSRDATDRTALRKDILSVASQAAAEKEELQLAKLPRAVVEEQLPHQDLVAALKRLQPSPPSSFNRRRAQKLAEELAGQLTQYVAHDNGEKAPFDFRWLDPETGTVFVEDTGVGEKGFARLIFRLWECATLGTRAVTLSLRVCHGCRLHEVCQALDTCHDMSTTICPSTHWCFGPPTQQADVESEADVTTRNNRLPGEYDKRYYLIIGSPGALTKSHWDRGVQTVLYHTIAGTNHAFAVPRDVALILQAVDFGTTDTSWANKLEMEVLRACNRVVRVGTFSQGETMLIMPGGGHAVLTGDDGKVVLAGEWHLRTDIGKSEAPNICPVEHSE